MKRNLKEDKATVLKINIALHKYNVENVEAFFLFACLPFFSFLLFVFLANLILLKQSICLGRPAGAVFSVC